MSALVSIIIPVRDQLKYFKQCYLFVKERTHAKYTLIIVNDGSGPDATNYINSLKDIKLIHNKTPQGYPKACNQGIRIADTEFVCLLNSDVVVPSRWLKRLLEGAEDFPSGGMFGPTCARKSYQSLPESYLITRPTEVDKFASIIYKKYRKNYADTMITGFCCLIRSKLFKEIGLLDERFGLGGGEDKEFRTRAIHAGWKAIWVKHAFVWHYGNVSFAAAGIDRKELHRKNTTLRKQIEAEYLKK